MERALHYIARKDEFEKAVSDCGELRVYAVFADGTTHITTLSGYIKEVVRHEAGFLVRTSTMKGDRYLTLYLL